MVNKPAALVTGSAIRLGKEIALALAKDGYDIAIHYRSSEAAAQATVEEIKAVGVNCSAFQFDLTQTKAIPAFVEKVKNAFPHLSVLVNSASSYNPANIKDTTPDMFDLEFTTNLKAPFFLSQAFVKQIQQGNIINIIDNKIGYHQYPYAAYLLAKKTLAAFTQMAALEFAPNFRVNGVAPGVVFPASSRTSDYIQWRIDGIPIQKQGHFSNITAGILSLLNNDFINGQILVIDGGENINVVGRHSENYLG